MTVAEPLAAGSGLVIAAIALAAFAILMLLGAAVAPSADSSRRLRRRIAQARRVGQPDGGKSRVVRSTMGVNDRIKRAITGRVSLDLDIPKDRPCLSGWARMREFWRDLARSLPQR